MVLIQNGGLGLAVIQNCSRRQDVWSYTAPYCLISSSSAIFVCIVRHFITYQKLKLG